MDFCPFAGNFTYLCAPIERTERIYHRLGGTRSALRERCVLNARVKVKNSVRKTGEALPTLCSFRHRLISVYAGARNARVPKLSKKRNDKSS